ncbi:hypothetical protein [Actinopolyspora mortivallis]|uniref:Cell division protein FtsL n=1 Tax=Actinopolyspora mortivallis TaxID=33906 RepID=A0A2T0GZ79_ACTMO|nr:hypothetical protein [Actinopolyspora mortivallis]PRW64411.1 hypothetical protein CEP50_05700 [Actinopolyspora mortivallis]
MTTASARGGNRGERRRGRKRQRGEQRSEARVDRGGRVRSSSAERAYERKRERGEQAERHRANNSGGDVSTTTAKRATRAHDSGRSPSFGTGMVRPVREFAARVARRLAHSRAPFVGTVMVVLVSGVVATLWLSIAAVSNSYRIQDSKERVQALTERKEDLLRSVSRMSSISEVQRRVEEMNMVPAPEPAHLVVEPDGSVRLVGHPRAATAPEENPEESARSDGQAPDGDTEDANQQTSRDDTSDGRTADPESTHSNDPSAGQE